MPNRVIVAYRGGGELRSSKIQREEEVQIQPDQNRYNKLVDIAIMLIESFPSLTGGYSFIIKSFLSLSVVSSSLS
jgi:hypothetical protein